VQAAIVDFAERVVPREDVAGKRVVEVGSRNVNGSIRPFFAGLDPESYIGFDVRDGPGVDVVIDCEKLTHRLGGSFADFVVCVETLEHIENWQAAMLEIATALRPGGHLLLATLTPHEPDSPGVVLAHDHWSFTAENIGAILQTAGFSDMLVEENRAYDGVLAYATRASLDNIVVHQLKGVHRRCGG
jgi:SAM-dependent methyltransferase